MEADTAFYLLQCAPHFAGADYYYGVWVNQQYNINE